MGQKKVELELAEESDLVLEKLAEEVIKVKSLDLEVFTKWDLKRGFNALASSKLRKASLRLSDLNNLDADKLKTVISISVLKDNHIISDNVKTVKFYSSESFDKKVVFSDEIKLSAGVKNQYVKNGD